MEMICRDSLIPTQPTKYKFGRIGVLMGGVSSEREISLKSGRAVFDVLKQSGMDVIDIDITAEEIEENIRLIKSSCIDCAFIALHGRFGEDGQIQQILDDCGISYTGSGVLASRLAMDKIASRRVFESCNLEVPKYKVIDNFLEDSFDYSKLRDFVYPLVVKPVTQGSSVGLSIVDNKTELAKALVFAYRFDRKILVEEYVAGREVTVGILNNQALPVIEIIPRKRFFDFEAKYQSGMTDYVIPAKLEEETVIEVQKAGLAAHQALGCYGFSRVDMILKKEKIPVILEINTIPGFTQTSLLPKAASVAGIDFFRLCVELIRLAYEKAQV